MKSYRIGLLAAVAALTLGLTACGSDDSGGSSPAGSGGATGGSGGATGGTGGATGGTGGATGGTGGATGGTGGATGGTGGATGGTGGATGGTGGGAGAAGVGGTGGSASPDDDNDGYTVADGDCDDSDPNVNPGATEICNGVDDDCANGIDDGVLNDYYVDNDDDKIGVDDPATNQQACEPPNGYASVAGDCDDNDAFAFPGNPEVCDGIDNDCANGVDDGVTLNTYYEDTDMDGFGDDASTQDGCVPPSTGNWVTQGGDCDDTDPERFPGNPEICDNKDNDCDATTPEPGADTYYEDADGDGYGDDASTQTQCGGAPSGYVAQPGDCDDSDPDINPGEIELCDDIDNNCINGVDEGPVETWPDADDDGFGEQGASITYLCEVKDGTAGNDADCDDTNANINPDAAEIPGNGTDENCDGDDTAAGTLCGNDSVSATEYPYHYDGSLNFLDSSTGGPAGDGYRWDDVELSTNGGEDLSIMFHSDDPTSFNPRLYVYGPNSCTTLFASDTTPSSNSSPKGAHLAYVKIPSATAGYYYTALTTTVAGDAGNFLYDVYPGDLGGSCGGDRVQLYPLGWRSNGSLTSFDNEPSGTPVGSGYLADDYEFYLEAGEPVSLVMGGTNFSDRMILAAAGSCATEIESSSTGPFGGSTLIHYTPSTAGVYAAYITSTTSGQMGDYTFNVIPGTLGLECFQGPGSIGGEGQPYVIYPLGQSTYASLSLTDRSGDFGARLFDDFETYLEVGDEITVNVTRSTGSFTPRIYLTRPNSCTTIIESSSQISGATGSLSFTATQAGTYVIVITSVQTNATGNYTLTTTLD